MGIDTVIFDYGGVVADDYCEPFASDLAELIGTDRARIEPLISEASNHGALFRTSAISRDEFWDEVSRLAGVEKFSSELAQSLWARTYVPNAGMLNLLRQLREDRGVFVCIFSNMDKDRLAYTKALTDWSLYVDRLVASSDTGYLKPSERAFQSVLQECGRVRAPERVLFVDDRSSHLVAAERFGLTGYHFKNQELLLAFLDDLPLVARTT